MEVQITFLSFLFSNVLACCPIEKLQKTRFEGMGKHWQVAVAESASVYNPIKIVKIK